MEPEVFKTYNEMLKTFESLAQRESELLQKLSQSDRVDPKQKELWAEELASVIKAASTLDKKRQTLVEKLQQHIETI